MASAWLRRNVCQVCDGGPPVPDQVFGDRRLGDFEAKLEQLAVNAWGAPQWILLAHPSDEIAQLTLYFRLARSTARSPTPIGPKPGSMPPQDCARLNDPGQTGQTWPEPSHPYQQRPYHSDVAADGVEHASEQY
jgi:hypothetical protein